MMFAGLDNAKTFGLGELWFWGNFSLQCKVDFFFYSAGSAVILDIGLWGSISSIICLCLSVMCLWMKLSTIILLHQRGICYIPLQLKWNIPNLTWPTKTALIPQVKQPHIKTKYQIGFQNLTEVLPLRRIQKSTPSPRTNIWPQGIMDASDSFSSVNLELQMLSSVQILSANTVTGW